MHLYNSDHFSTNTGTDYTFVLSKSVLLAKGKWSCALVSLLLTKTLSSPVYLCVDVCGESIVGNFTLPVLRSILDSYTEPVNLAYIPVRVLELSRIRVYLRTQTGQPVSLSDIDSSCTLHFRMQELTMKLQSKTPDPAAVRKYYLDMQQSGAGAGTYPFITPAAAAVERAKSKLKGKIQKKKTIKRKTRKSKSQSSLRTYTGNFN